MSAFGGKADIRHPNHDGARAERAQRALSDFSESTGAFCPQGSETNPLASLSHWSEASSTHDTPRHARRRMADRINQILPRALRARSTPQRNAETSSVLPPYPQALALRS